MPCGDFEWRRREKKDTFLKNDDVVKFEDGHLESLKLPKSTRTHYAIKKTLKQQATSDHGIQVPIQDCPPQPGEGEYTTLCCCLLLLK